MSAAAGIRSVAIASAAPHSEHVSEMPISEVSDHLDEVADESAATGELTDLMRSELTSNKAAIRPWHRRLRRS